MHRNRIAATVASVVLSFAAMGCTHDPAVPVPVARIAVSPASPFLVVTDTLRLTASPLDASGNPLTGHETHWTSLDSSRATVSDSGTVTGHSLGTVNVIASAGGRAETTSVVVVPVPEAVRVEDFFTAFTWVAKLRATPVRTHLYDVSQCPEIPAAPCLADNATQRRVQWNDVWDWQPVAQWAASNRGHLYTIGDDLNAGSYGGIYVNDPKRYADDYCTFVSNVQRVDSTAEFTSTMINQPVERWWLDGVAGGILAAYNKGACGRKPISEWIFNTYPGFEAGMAGFTGYVQRQIDWTQSLPEPIRGRFVIGAFVLGWPLDDVPNDDPRYVQRVREAKAWLFANRKIGMARYLAYEPWPEVNSDPHPLADAAGNLNATGRAFAEVTGRIAGPSTIRPATACLWNAETTGGSPPFRYEWFVNDRPFGTRRWLVSAQSSSSFVLRLDVIDANGGRSVATMTVTTSDTAPPCASGG